MTDVAEQAAQNVNEAEAAEAAKAQKAPKVDPTKPCYCSLFEVGNFETAGTTEEEIFSTGCEQTTKRTFAQGHDARLVSFLVDGHFDGYKIRIVKDGVATNFGTPEAAARTASDSLGDKAAKATQNRADRAAAKETAKAAREAEKAAKKAEADKAKAAKKEAAEKAKAEAASAKKDAPHAEVAAGSTEGDQTPLAEGQVKIKVGRWEFPADIDPETEVATYVNGKGETCVIERDGYRVLTPTA